MSFTGNSGNPSGRNRRIDPVFTTGNNDNSENSQATPPMNPPNPVNNHPVNLFELIKRNNPDLGFEVFKTRELQKMNRFISNITENDIFNRDYGILNNPNIGMPIILDDIIKVMIYKRNPLTRKRGTERKRVITTKYKRQYYNFFIPHIPIANIVSNQNLNITQLLNTIYARDIVERTIQSPKKHFILRVDPTIARLTNMNTRDKQLSTHTLLDEMLYDKYNSYMTNVIDRRTHYRYNVNFIYESNTGLISGYSNDLSNPLETGYTYTEPNIRYQYVVPIQDILNLYMNSYLKANKIVPATITNNRPTKRARYEIEVRGGGHIKFINNKDLL